MVCPSVDIARVSVSDVDGECGEGIPCTSLDQPATGRPGRTGIDPELRSRLRQWVRRIPPHTERSDGLWFSASSIAFCTPHLGIVWPSRCYPCPYQPLVRARGPDRRQATCATCRGSCVEHKAAQEG